MKKCRTCHAQMVRKPRESTMNWDRRMFCSMECSAESRRNLEARTCPVCQVLFQPEKSRSLFCSRRCFNESQRTGRGYVQTTHNGATISEHRLVMERHLGRKLLPTEHVHHKNENKRDNRIENLMVLTIQEHTTLHRSKHPTEKPCENCGTIFTPHPKTRGRVKTCSTRCRYELTAKTLRAGHS